jgi:hypothetical protein
MEDENVYEMDLREIFGPKIGGEREAGVSN